jgi:hypothetical protein
MTMKMVEAFEKITQNTGTPIYGSVPQVDFD